MNEFNWNDFFFHPENVSFSILNIFCISVVVIFLYFMFLRK